MGPSQAEKRNADQPRSRYWPNSRRDSPQLRVHHSHLQYMGLADGADNGEDQGVGNSEIVRYLGVPSTRRKGHGFIVGITNAESDHDLCTPRRYLLPWSTEVVVVR